MKSKNTIAHEIYGSEYDFDDLTSGEQGAVTRQFNAQPQTRASRVVASSTAKPVKATIGRVADNGSKTCLLAKGATVNDLLEQSGYGFDSKKEKIIAVSTGRPVTLSTPLKHGEDYGIVVEIKSAL